MIQLKSVSGKEFYLNNDLIFKIERDYDTLITLIDHKTIRVMDTPEEISKKIISFKRDIFQSQPGGN